MIRFARKFALAVGKDPRFPLADFFLEERVVQLYQPAVMFNQNSVYQTGSLTIGFSFTGNPNFPSVGWLVRFVSCFRTTGRCLRLCDVPDEGRSQLSLSLLAAGKG